MIDITAPNVNAIVSEIGDAVVDKDGCPGTKRDNAISPQPSMETLSFSSVSISTNNNYSYKDNGSEFNDCSSSVSSQDSSNNNIHIFTRTNFKRSVFSQYWQSTGEKPVLLRPVKPPSPSDLIQKGLSWTDTTLDAPATSIASKSVSLNHSPLLQFPRDESLMSMSNADLLEDDECDCATSTREREQDRNSPQHPIEEAALPLPEEQSRAPRRRSILPPAPMSHPALKSTTPQRTRSWRKSASLSNVEGYSRWNKPSLDAAKHKTNSLPRMRSSSMIPQPGPSCLRSHQRYSPSKPDRRKSINVASPLCTRSQSPHASASSPALSLSPPGLLSRPVSPSSSVVSAVSFLEAVDVRHFEPPRETYSGKGWSEYFN